MLSLPIQAFSVKLNALIFLISVAECKALNELNVEGIFSNTPFILNLPVRA